MTLELVREQPAAWAVECAELERTGAGEYYLAALRYSEMHAQGWSLRGIADEVTRAGFKIHHATVDRRLQALESCRAARQPSSKTLEVFAEAYVGANHPEIDLGGLKASTSVEWYTPAHILDAARAVMGGIDLDPATSELANEVVRAPYYFTAKDDGLQQAWFGRVWLNPPYGRQSGAFAAKLLADYTDGRVTQAILLLNAYGFDNDWFEPLWAFPMCFTHDRIEFYSPAHKSGGPANGNVLIYLGDDPLRFAEVFRPIGQVVRAWP